MKRTKILAIGLAAAMCSTGPAMAVSGSGDVDYDLATQNAPALTEGHFELSQDASRYDSEGYLLGPNGERISKPLRPRWRVGVFR